MTTRQRILLDCDPGIDDAMAILCALRYADLAAVTTVSGNVTIDNTTRNARYILDLAGADVPVHRGAAAPLEVTVETADYIHGASGLGDMTVPEVSAAEPADDAVEAILDFCADGDAVIVAIGPLTNIALALRKDPSLPERIAQLHWMGGSTAQGNVTEHAEFNAWADPHAADIVFSSNVALTMYGLNLTHQVRMGERHIDQLRAAGTTTGLVTADLLRHYYDHGLGDAEGKPIHDPCAILGATHPDLFQTVESNIVANTTLDDLRGKTEVQQQRAATDAAMITVAETVDADAVLDLVVRAATDPQGRAS